MRANGGGVARFNAKGECVNGHRFRQKEPAIEANQARQTNGATQWTRIFVTLVAAVEMFFLISVVLRGRGSLGLVAEGVVMVFIVAVTAIGPGTLEMNERFTALLELIGEDE